MSSWTRRTWLAASRHPDALPPRALVWTLRCRRRVTEAAHEPRDGSDEGRHRRCRARILEQFLARIEHRARRGDHLARCGLQVLHPLARRIGALLLGLTHLSGPPGGHVRVTSAVPEFAATRDETQPRPRRTPPSVCLV